MVEARLSVRFSLSLSPRQPAIIKLGRDAASIFIKSATQHAIQHFRFAHATNTESIINQEKKSIKIDLCQNDTALKMDCVSDKSYTKTHYKLKQMHKKYKMYLFASL